MEELKRITNESISLVIRYDEYRVTIEKVDSSLTVRHMIKLGKPFPLFAGAAGKVILAYLSKEEVTEIISRTNFKKHNNYSCTIIKGIGKNKKRRLCNKSRRTYSRCCCNSSGNF